MSSNNEMIEIADTPFSYSASLEERLEEIANRITQMRKGGELTPESLNQLRKALHFKTVYHSNAIEGNALDLGETEMVLRDGLTISGKSLQDQAEAKSLHEATGFMEALAKEAQPITEKDIREIHALVLKGIADQHAGKYRTGDVTISGSEYKPPSHPEVPPKMEDFGRWLASATSGSLHSMDKQAIVNAAVAHTDFVIIHPFTDGNGRVARLLLNLLLIRAGIPIAIITKEDRLRYYDALEEAQSGNLTPFMQLLLDVLEDSLLEYERVMAGEIIPPLLRARPES